MSAITSPVLVVFGAGPGLGASVARRFGREGFRVALVGRRQEPLQDFAETLKAEGIEAAPFTADLSDPARIPSLIADIRERFGRIDVIEYGPASAADQGFVPAAELDTADLEKYLRLFLLTPVEIVRSVLPELIERGNGAILVTHGSSSATGIPFLSGVGPAMAAMRNYLYSLNGELEGTGVYAGTLTIGALITSGEPFADQGFPGDAEAAATFPTVHPDTLAGLYWDMYVQRGAAEQAYPQLAVTA
ncbi:SDR family NAD(P)-dependent oxidoreductase [Arthrobacter sp. Sa2BUA2]|uniref:SDR family NAD(P)-dependent oxidoreductase n=1 Tax=Arthrobacter pullicola TaxID=2762224 RepID=A0ABR8YM95_9MICC|nr:SDR family NAD(P)-dependent oxidoreductase [Arthrobacter pullicola]MBD8045373.1 SDR family NAD(P)-dependent oxidoreductase [Arthrobacter pullicola]